MKKQNWFCKLVLRLCNCNKKETFATVNIPYNDVKKYIHKVTIKLPVPCNDDELIKCRLSQRIADYIVENNLIQYSVNGRISSIDDEFESFLVESNFVVLTYKNTENENPQIS